MSLHFCDLSILPIPPNPPTPEGSEECAWAKRENLLQVTIATRGVKERRVPATGIGKRREGVDDPQKKQPDPGKLEPVKTSVCQWYAGVPF